MHQPFSARVQWIKGSTVLTSFCRRSSNLSIEAAEQTIYRLNVVVQDRRLNYFGITILIDRLETKSTTSLSRKNICKPRVPKVKGKIWMDLVNATRLSCTIHQNTTDPINGGEKEGQSCGDSVRQSVICGEQSCCLRLYISTYSNTYDPTCFSIFQHVFQVQGPSFSLLFVQGYWTGLTSLYGILSFLCFAIKFGIFDL